MSKVLKEIKKYSKKYVRFHLIVQNVVSAQPCVAKLGKSHILLNILGYNCGW